jgi:uncharacterized YigZ family protein
VPSYRTIAHAVCTEIEPIKKSCFVADVAPVSSPEEALSFIAGVQKKHSDAGHHCYGWRLQAGDAGWRVSDDGEPSGTAGMPILARIDGQDLCGIVVVVTRWFGGTKLGKGGLIRAYGGAAAAVLSEAEVVVVRQTVSVQIRFDYSDQSAVEAVLRAMDLQPSQADYGAQVVLQVAVPTEETEALAQQLRDGTAGRVGVT